MKQVKFFTKCGETITVDVDTKQEITGYEIVPPKIYHEIGNLVHWTFRVEPPYHIIYEKALKSFVVYDKNEVRVAKLWEPDVPENFRKLLE